MWKTNYQTAKFFTDKLLGIKIKSADTYEKTSLLRFIIFLSGFSFTETDDSQDRRVREGTIFYSTLPLPPAHEHSDI